MKNLSINQTVILIAALVAMTVLTALHDVDGSVTVPVMAAIAANALGYVNGKKSGRNEVASEIGAHVTAAALGLAAPGSPAETAAAAGVTAAAVHLSGQPAEVPPATGLPA